jgi:hypothetical protein
MPTTTTAERWALAGWVGAATVLELIRQVGQASYDVLWAEDGPVFLGGALNHAFPAPVLDPYTGYVLVPSRLIAEVATVLPLNRAAIVLAAAPAVLAAAVSAFVYVASGAVLRSRWSRGVLAVLVVLAPVAGPEITANDANLHWFLDIGCFWALLVTPTGRGGRLAAVALVVAAGLSDLLTVAFVPLALAALLRARWRLRGAPVATAFLAAIVAQLALGWGSSSRGIATAGLSLDRLPRVFADRVLASMTVGDHFLRDGHLALGPALAWGSVLAVVVVVAASWRWGTERDRVFVGVSLFYAVVLFAVPVHLRGAALAQVPAVGGIGTRYVYVPVVLLYGVVILALDRVPRAWRVGAVVMAAVLALTTLSSYRVRTERSYGPSYTAALRGARASCRALSQRVRLDNPPVGFFAIRTTCARIR